MRLLFTWLSAAALALSLTDPGLAGDHAKKKDKRAAIPPSPAYAAYCGQCHFAYPAMLLPWDSWRRIMDGAANHFGESLDIPASDHSAIEAYLRSDSADVTKNKRGRKIMRAVGPAAPLRVSEVAYIREKHRKISPEVFQRKSVGSLANCIACHQGADRGLFDDDAVIPR